jgi:vesicle-fusing ATPase
VLFFDEADALYAKRVEEVRDAQDRFANVDTSHLMTALEAYPGIVLLASNLKGNIDSAFLRRIRHVVEFARPDAAARAEIWRRTLTGLFGATTCAALASDITRLAQLEASGAQIKTSALSSVFAARRARQQPNLTLLAQMLSRELAKEGAGLSTRDLAALTEGVP